jgi:hypothetical protein
MHRSRIKARRQIRATEVSAQLARGVPVTIQWARMELAQDILSKRYVMHPTLLAGQRRLDSLTELHAWAAKGSPVPKEYESGAG